MVKMNSPRKSRWVWSAEDVKMSEKQPEPIQDVAARVKQEQIDRLTKALEVHRDTARKYDVMIILEKQITPLDVYYLHILETRKEQHESMIIKLQSSLDRLL